MKYCYHPERPSVSTPSVRPENCFISYVDKQLIVLESLKLITWFEHERFSFIAIYLNVIYVFES